ASRAVVTAVLLPPTLERNSPSHPFRALSAFGGKCSPCPVVRGRSAAPEPPAKQAQSTRRRGEARRTRTQFPPCVLHPHPRTGYGAQLLLPHLLNLGLGSRRDTQA